MLELAGSQLAEKCTDFEYEFPKTFFLGTQRRSGRPTELPVGRDGYTLSGSHSQLFGRGSAPIRRDVAIFHGRTGAR